MGSIRGQIVIKWEREWPLRKISLKGKKNYDHRKRTMALTIIGSWKKSESVTQILSFPLRQTVLTGTDLMNILMEILAGR